MYTYKYSLLRKVIDRKQRFDRSYYIGYTYIQIYFYEKLSIETINIPDIQIYFYETETKCMDAGVNMNEVGRGGRKGRKEGKKGGKEEREKCSRSS